MPKWDEQNGLPEVGESFPGDGPAADRVCTVRFLVKDASWEATLRLLSRTSDFVLSLGDPLGVRVTAVEAEQSEGAVRDFMVKVAEGS